MAGRDRGGFAQVGSGEAGPRRAQVEQAAIGQGLGQVERLRGLAEQCDGRVALTQGPLVPSGTPEQQGPLTKQDAALPRRDQRLGLVE